MKFVKIKKIQLNMRQRNMLEGLVFVSPFIIGLLVFFAFPLYVSIKLSFGELVQMLGFKIKWLGFDHYMRAFVLDTWFLPMFFTVVRYTIMKIPLIIVFSLLLAILINKKIKFRGFFRVAFFLPFLLGTGFVMKQLLEQDVNQEAISMAKAIFIPTDVLMYLGPNVSKAVNDFFGIIVTVLWSSGVQIMLFLSGLQGISESLYESAKVDGATEWEMFWKITLPMISPIMLLNIVYTIIDSFTDINNPILINIQNYAFRWMQFEYAAAMGWIYFDFILLLVLLVFGIMKNHIYIQDMKGVNKDDRKNN